MKLILLLFTSAVLLAGCEKKPETQEAAEAAEAPETSESSTSLSNIGGKMEAALKESGDRHAERVKRGDTLTLSYKALEDYLPANVSGYTAEAPSGESTKGFMALSTAKRQYNQGDNQVKVAVVDYNGSYQMYQGVTAVFGMVPESESDESMNRPYPSKIAGVKGVESLNKKSGDAELTLALGDRFMVSVTANHQKDLTLVESVAQQVDLAKLAKL